MNMKIDITPLAEFLYVKYAGVFSLADAKATFKPILEACIFHRKRKVLVDVRQLTGAPTTMERYSYSEFCAYSIIDFPLTELRGTRFVYVGEIPLIDSDRFGETVARNRGMIVRVHESKELPSALEWLGLDPAVFDLESG